MSVSLREEIRRAGGIGILHHWDADGISSAATLLALADGSACRNASPAIGDYTDLKAPALDLLRHGPDLLVGLDLSTPGELLRELAQLAGSTRVIWIDHHSNPPTPPDGVRFYHPETMGHPMPPSNSWFLAALLGQPPGLLGAIGACGDLGPGLRAGPWESRVRSEAAGALLTVEELLTLTDLVDSNYRCDSREGVMEAPRVLADRLSSPASLMEVEDWKRNRAAVDRELDRILREPPESRGGFLINIFSSRMHLTSIVARRLASQCAPQGTRAVIVANAHRGDCPLYIRRTDQALDLTPLIKLGREWGASAGGKPEVVGMVVPRGEVAHTVELIERHLEARA